jgi:hypothetical protein
MARVPGHIRAAGEAVERALALAHEAGDQSSVRLLSAVLGLLRAVEFGGASPPSTEAQFSGAVALDGEADPLRFLRRAGFATYS